MQTLEELAQAYAKLKGTQIIALAFKADNSVTFVLASGQKINMTEAQLKDAIQAQTAPALSAGMPPAEKPKKKGKPHG